jgi:hypothetical protein
LVERDPHVLEPTAIFIARLTGGLSLPEFVLLGDKPFNRSVNLFVRHRGSS